MATLENIVCDSCKTRNPPGRKRCIHCGVLLAGSQAEAVAQPELASQTSITGNLPPVTATGDIYYPSQRDDNLAGRPGFVTIYMLLLLLAIGILLSLFLPVNIENTRRIDQLGLTESSLLIPAIVAVSVLLLVSCVGLWRMQNWARLAQVALLGLILMGDILLTIGSIMAFPRLFATTLIAAVPRWVIEYNSLRWFITNRRRFS